jgi:hypothetical protein
VCELAQELDLEKITSTNDYELSQVNRRTITENGVIGPLSFIRTGAVFLSVNLMEGSVGSK